MAANLNQGRAGIHFQTMRNLLVRMTSAGCSRPSRTKLPGPGPLACTSRRFVASPSPSRNKALTGPMRFAGQDPASLLMMNAVLLDDHLGTQARFLLSPVLVCCLVREGIHMSPGKCQRILRHWMRNGSLPEQLVIHDAKSGGGSAGTLENLMAR